MNLNPLFALDLGSCGIKGKGVTPTATGYAGQPIQDIYFEASALRTTDTEDVLDLGGQRLLAPAEFGMLYGKSAANADVKRGALTRKEYQYDEIWFGFVFAAIAELHEKMQLGSDITGDVGLGFPSEHIMIAGELTKTLLAGNPWTIQKAGSEPFQFTFGHIVTRPQSYYLPVDQIVQWVNGALSNQRGKSLLKNGAVLFAGFGGNTLELSRVTYSLEEAEKFSFPSGAFDLLQDIQQQAFPVLHKTLSPFDLMHGVFKDKSWRGHDFSMQINEIIKQRIPLFQQEIADFMKNFGDARRAVLGGGFVIHAGAQLVSAFAPLFDDGASIAVDDMGNPSPLDAFARGILKKLTAMSLRGWGE